MQKTVYFLRHGETAGNRAWVHQYPETQLSGQGRVQAALVAEYFRSVPLDLILTSPLARATETAHIVRGDRDLPLEESEDVVEFRRPRDIWGTSWLNPRSLFIMAKLYYFAGREGWHHSDEENLEEFHTRARRALELLAARPERNILVVTHRGFMENIMERIRADGMDSIAQYRRSLWKNLTIGNCCFCTAHWKPEGEEGLTLGGTWSIEGGTTCPSGRRLDLGLG